MKTTHCHWMTSRRTLRRVAIILCVQIWIWCTVDAQSQTRCVLDTTIREVTASTGELSSTLQEISHEYKIAIGFVPLFPIDIPTADAQRVTLKEKSLRDVLDFLMDANPKYRWRLENDVILVEPNIQQDAYGFLDLSVPQFEAKNETASEIKVKIAQDSGVARYLQKEGAEIKELAFLPGGDERADKLSFVLTKTTIRHILDEVVRQGTRKFWTLGRWGDENRFIWIIIS